MTARTPAASAAKVRVSQPFSSVGTSSPAWTSSVAATASPPVSLSEVTPATIERLAGAPLIFYDAESADRDPIRRQLAERAQGDGVGLRPRIEVEFTDMALALVARGLGDTYLPSAYTRAPFSPGGLTTAPSSPASTTRSP